MQKLLNTITLLIAKRDLKRGILVGTIDDAGNVSW